MPTFGSKIVEADKLVFLGKLPGDSQLGLEPTQIIFYRLGIAKHFDFWWFWALGVPVTDGQTYNFFLNV